MPVAYVATATGLSPLPPAGSSCVGPSLPNSLVVPAASYCFNGTLFDLRQGGLHRFFDISAGLQQRLVLPHGPEGIADFLVGVSWLVSHANHDNSNSGPVLERLALRRRLHLTCHHVTSFAMHLLRRWCGDVSGFAVRGARLFPSEEQARQWCPQGHSADWRHQSAKGKVSCDDGHVVLEVFGAFADGPSRPQRWAMVDLDMKAMAVDWGGRNPLSVLELYRCIRRATLFKWEEEQPFWVKVSQALKSLRGYYKSFCKLNYFGLDLPARVYMASPDSEPRDAMSGRTLSEADARQLALEEDREIVSAQKHAVPPAPLSDTHTQPIKRLNVVTPARYDKYFGEIMLDAQYYACDTTRYCDAQRVTAYLGSWGYFLGRQKHDPQLMNLSAFAMTRYATPPEQKIGRDYWFRWSTRRARYLTGPFTLTDPIGRGGPAAHGHGPAARG